MADFKLGKNTLTALASLRKARDPRSEILIDAVKEFIEVTPIDFCIIPNGGYRTIDMQQELFANGKSKCDGLSNVSKHQLGLAVDLVPWTEKKGKYKCSWDVKDTFYLAGAFMAFCKEKSYNITSGADWNKDGILIDGWDPCHMELGE